MRDLPAREGSVRPADDFSMDGEEDPRAQRHIKEIANALKGARHLYLATDPDREGEAISWHVHEVLKDRNALGGVEVQRVVERIVRRLKEKSYGACVGECGRELARRLRRVVERTARRGSD